jgi:hypothetical protein
MTLAQQRLWWLLWEWLVYSHNHFEELAAMALVPIRRHRQPIDGNIEEQVTGILIVK